ncbi:MAG: toll/interleukin-1 receptor domain-containing protein [Phormidesmis sp. CAN_BIN44]|nr:toll/interleukin-1 receptor domain-containing protein [Phormidesmis sp. CAN_BIN44]
MTAPVSNLAIAVFFSYAHAGEKLRDKLTNHLKLLERQGVIQSWYDRQLLAGTERQGQIDSPLETAQIILLLVSADFLASDYCYDIEMKRALERHDAGEARVIPVILRPVDNWRKSPFGKLQALPTDSKAVTCWENEDKAFTIAAKGIRLAAEAWQPGERFLSLEKVQKT